MNCFGLMDQENSKCKKTTRLNLQWFLCISVELDLILKKHSCDFYYLKGKKKLTENQYLS